jgi:signal peptidase II
MKQRISNFILFILLIAVDQVSKYWARTTLQEKGPFSIIPKVLKLQYHENNGAVWGILSGKISFLVILTVILMLVLTFFYLKIPGGSRYTPIRMIWIFIMAGAIGNFIDRITLRYVVDFIYIELIDFPIFNFADMCLTLSCVLLVILILFYYKEKDLAFIDEIFRRRKNTESESNSGKDE